MAGGKSKPRAGPKATSRRQDPAPWYATKSTRSKTKPKPTARIPISDRGRSRGPDGRFLPLPSVPYVPEPAGATRDCTICAETREETEFPQEQISEACLHPPGVCLVCIQTSIKVEFSSKRWNQIHCPECRELLDYHHVRKYADEETFAKYENVSLRAAVGEASDFVWCPAGCGSGQLHETGPGGTGRESPIVSCVQCSHRFCFVHAVAWHEGLTCADYDTLQSDPQNFRRQVDIDNEAIERRLRQARRKREKQEEADRLYAQSLVDKEQAKEAKRVAQREQALRDQREQAERAQRHRERAAEAARNQALQQAAEQTRLQEQRSLEKIGQTTRICPGCRWPIEKGGGCDHMSCSRCGYEFCYLCRADYTLIRAHGNHYHKRNCQWYA